MREEGVGSTPSLPPPLQGEACRGKLSRREVGQECHERGGLGSERSGGKGARDVERGKGWSGKDEREG